MQVSLDVLVKTDEPAAVEWAVIANNQVLSNGSRDEFDGLIDGGSLPFALTDSRCYTEAPTDSAVRPSMCSGASRIMHVSSSRMACISWYTPITGA